MEQHLNPLAVTHLLQQALRSLCIQESSLWVYAVFWRILPRNYPPPKWDIQGPYDRSRGNRRNWILAWEDGFCNFAASAVEHADSHVHMYEGSSDYGNCDSPNPRGLRPELFFKMSHEIYNYGEGLIGKVAADHSHKWVFSDPEDHETNFLSAWHNPADSLPRTWEAQFQCGVKTIALVAVREGVVQLGALNKVIEDPSYVVHLQKKFSYLESIPGVLMPHPSSSLFPCSIPPTPPHLWTQPVELFYDQPLTIVPSMSSLEALLSKLPSVAPPPATFSGGNQEVPMFLPSSQRPLDKEEEVDDDGKDIDLAGETSNCISSYHLNVAKSGNGF